MTRKKKLSSYQVMVFELLEERERYIKTTNHGDYLLVEADGSTVVKQVLKKSVEAMERLGMLKRDRHDNLALI